MKPGKVLRRLRKKQGLSQDEMAEKCFVTRQAVSRWENGKTMPSIDTLALISKMFGVTINTLLGEPIKLYCQACGMPLADESVSRGKDGSFDEKHCKWCYVEGNYVGPESMEEMIEVCVPHMHMPADAAREFLRKQLPQLEHWRESQQ